MKLITDTKNPDLMALLDSDHELATIEGWVDHLNKDLIDSGFDRYQFKAELNGDKAYIKRV